jgi:carbohydrate-binding DOMON domain-containing protein
MKFAEITNPWHAPYGFSHQLVQIYIDNDDGGATSVFKKGANVRFSPEAPWDKLIKINGWNIKVFDYQDDLKENTGKISEADVQVLDNKETIQVKVPQEVIGDLDSAQYYILVASLDGFSYDNYRPVVKEVSEWKFGGGTDTEFNPNVLDTILPENKAQKEVLSSYDPEKKELAMLYPVGSNSPSLNKILLLLIVPVIITSIFIIFKYRCKSDE